MTRVQILLTEEQARRLETLARQLHTSKAKLVREGVDYVLERKQAPVHDPILDLIGQAGQVGAKDISDHHDSYLRDAKLRENS